MKTLTASIVFIVLLSAGIYAQNGKTPAFSQFRIKVEKIGSITVDVSTKNARMFRTNLRNAAKGGVNFAGHYIVHRGDAARTAMRSLSSMLATERFFSRQS